MTTTQEPQKGIMEEVELDFPHQDDNCWLMIDVSGIKVRQYPSPLEVKMLIHHQLQKARQDWLREEIVKLEGMKKDIPTRQVHWLQTINKTNRRYARKKAEAHNQALQAIIDRYQKELNQDPVHDFFTAPEEVQRPVYERALQKTQEEQEKITNNQTL